MSRAASRLPLDAGLRRIIEARHHDPFEVLGRHADGALEHVRVFRPGVTALWLEGGDADAGRRPLERLAGTDLFSIQLPAGQLVSPYRIGWRDGAGREWGGHDPYSFGPTVAQSDLDAFNAGEHRRAHRFLGAEPCTVQGVAGVRFAVWAPNAERVSVVGDFNAWDGRVHPMRVRGGSGIWELFLPAVEPGALYKFEIRARDGSLRVKNDPCGRRFELRPAHAPLVAAPSEHRWGDAEWMAARATADWRHRPLSVYEVHLGSWQRGADDAFVDYRTLAERLVEHVSALGFTHIELMPLTEHPLDASWGYQSTGFFAPTSRHGDADGLRVLVDSCHQAGIGVLLDWVPGHFPRDAHGLARFDGTPLYEHADPRLAEHPEWGTLTFNFGRNEVRSFLVSSACYWLEEFHLDGLRVDAVASMLYLDYARGPGQWGPNRHGGRENLEAIGFLRDLNVCLHGEFPGAMIIAEESTAWPQVTRPTYVGGLGFSMKWNMGWMHDTLDYMSLDPVFRQYHHDRLTFGMMYSHNENFVLPFSHDEVVHGKRSLIGRMPGDDWQRFANLRLLYAFQFSYPGKKLLFMGGEMAQWREWDESRSLDWALLEHAPHAGIARLLGDLNRLYRSSSALHECEFEPHGFEWIDCHDATQSVLSYLRRDSSGAIVVVVLNFTPVPRLGYRLGVPQAGRYEEILNSDAEPYGGSGLGNGGVVEAGAVPWMGRPCSIELTLPPLGALLLRPA